jgi:hypothetical protein
VVDDAVDAWAAYAFSLCVLGRVIYANSKRGAISCYAKLGH